MTMKSSSINIDPEIMGGTPVFSVTRVTIQSLFDWLESETLEAFLRNFPSVKKEQAIEVLHLAEKLVTDENIIG